MSAGLWILSPASSGELKDTTLPCSHHTQAERQPIINNYVRGRDVIRGNSETDLQSKYRIPHVACEIGYAMVHFDE